MSKFMLYFTKVTGFLPALLFYKWKIFYQDRTKQGRHLPKGSILMSNHMSLLDFPLYLMVFFREPVHFLVAEVLYRKTPILAWLLKALGSVYVDRNSCDFSFIEEAAGLLRNGERVGIFPEGQLPRNGKMSPFLPSCVMIALAADAEIVPVYTDGRYGLFRQVHVMIGERIRLSEYCASKNPSKEEIQKCNDILLSKILELKAALHAETEHGKA